MRRAFGYHTLLQRSWRKIGTYHARRCSSTRRLGIGSRSHTIPTCVLRYQPLSNLFLHSLFLLQLHSVGRRRIGAFASHCRATPCGRIIFPQKECFPKCRPGLPAAGGGKWTRCRLVVPFHIQMSLARPVSRTTSSRHATRLTT